MVSLHRFVGEASEPSPWAECKPLLLCCNTPASGTTLTAHYCWRVAWHRAWQQAADANATLSYCYRYFVMLRLFYLSKRKKLLGLQRRIYLASAVLFQWSDVPSAVFIKSFCQAGNPALLHYSSSATETGESEVPTTTLMTCKEEGGDSAMLASAVAGASPAAVIIAEHRAQKWDRLHAEGRLRGCCKCVRWTSYMYSSSFWAHVYGGSNSECCYFIHFPLR